LAQTLNLTTIYHHKFPWRFKDENMVVKQQVEVNFSIGYYEEKNLYDEVPMEACDILLKQPRQVDP